MKKNEIVALLVIALSLVLLAEDRAEAQVWKRGWLSGLELSLAPNYYHVANKTESKRTQILNRYDGAIGVGYAFAPWLKPYAKLHIGRTDLDIGRYPVTRDMTLSIAASNKIDTSVETGLISVIPIWRGLAIEASASYEFIPYWPRFTVDSVKLNAPMGEADLTNLARKTAVFDYRIDKVSLGLGASWRLGRWTPRLKAYYYPRIAGSFRMRLDKETVTMISIFGYDESKTPGDISAASAAFAFAPGLTVDLGHGLAIDLEAASSPIGDSWFLTGTLGVVWRPKP